MTIGEFASLAYAYCRLTRASVTSWIRSDQHNATVGGVALSAHRFGLGLDLVYDAPVGLEERVAIAQRLGLMLVVENDHDHLQPAGWGRS